MDLGSLNMENIEDIIASLSDDDIEKLTSMAGEFFSSSQKDENKTSESKKGKTSAPDSANFFSGIDPQTMMKIANLMGKLNSGTNDPRCDFLAALKPLLSRQKQQKADEAIRMLQLFSILPYLKDL